MGLPSRIGVRSDGQLGDEEHAPSHGNRRDDLSSQHGGGEGRRGQVGDATGPGDRERPLHPIGELPVEETQHDPQVGIRRAAEKAVSRLLTSSVETMMSARAVVTEAACRISFRLASPMINGMRRSRTILTPRASGLRSTQTTSWPCSCRARTTRVPTSPRPTTTMWSATGSASPPAASVSRALTTASTTAAVSTGISATLTTLSRVSVTFSIPAASRSAVRAAQRREDCDVRGLRQAHLASPRPGLRCRRSERRRNTARTRRTRRPMRSDSARSGYRRRRTPRRGAAGRLRASTRSVRLDRPSAASPARLGPQ